MPPNRHLLCCTLMPTPAYAWGSTGHRVTGAIAERYLSGVARAQIELLIGNESLAEGWFTYRSLAVANHKLRSLRPMPM